MVNRSVLSFVSLLIVTAEADKPQHLRQLQALQVQNPLSPVSWLDAILNVEIPIPDAIGPPDDSVAADLLPRVYAQSPVPESEEAPILRPAVEIPGIGVLEAVPRLTEITLNPPIMINRGPLSTMGFNRILPTQISFTVPTFIQPIPREAPSWMDRPWLGFLNPALNYAGSQATS